MNLMNDEELKQLWRDSCHTRDTIEISFEIKDALRKFDTDIQRRDWQEIVIAIVLMPVFALAAYFIEPMLSRVAAIITIPALLFIVFKLRQVRKSRPDYDSSSLKEYLALYRVYLINQKLLLERALYWYILPCGLPMLLFFVGQERYLLAAFTLPLYYLVYRINKKAAKEELQPLIDKVDNQLTDLESDVAA